MRAVALTFALLLLPSCDAHEATKPVSGPHGVTAQIKERTRGKSSTLEVVLHSPRAHQGVQIFYGEGGSNADVVFDGNIIIVQYCYPLSYHVQSYLYSLGEDYAYTDIRVSVGSVESQIGKTRVCGGGISGRPKFDGTIPH